MRLRHRLLRNVQFTDPRRVGIIATMNTPLPCVLMRAGTSRGPFFLRDWLPADTVARDETLIGAIGASDLLQVDGVGGGSTLTSKVAIVSRSERDDCDVDYLFAQVGVGQRSVDTRPNCGNMLSGVAPFAIEQGLVPAQEGSTTVRVFNVNTRSRIDVTVRTPGGKVTYEGDVRIDGVAGTASPIHLNFLDAWGAVTGQVFPTGRRIDLIDGVEATCIDAAMPLMIVRAESLGVDGREKPGALDANLPLMQRLEAMRLEAGRLMGLGDVSQSVIPKPVLVSRGDDADSITSRYFTPRRCHASHAVTGAIGVATAFALPGTVASGEIAVAGRRNIVVLHPAGRIDVEVELDGDGGELQIRRAALLRTARKIMQGELHIPDYVYSRPDEADAETAVSTAAAPNAPASTALPATARAAAPAPAAAASPSARPITLVVPTPAGGGNDTMAHAIAQRLGALLGQPIVIDNRAGAHGVIASEFVARARPDGHTLMFGYIATHAINPALGKLGYDPLADFAPVGLIGFSPTLLVANADLPVRDVAGLLAQLRQQPEAYRYASAGNGTAPHLAAELFKLNSGTRLRGVTFKGSAEAIAETIAGRTQLMFPSLYAASPHVGAGRLRALAVAGAQRLPGLSEVPTLREAGIDGVEMTQWYALFAPAHTPQPVVERLNRALGQVLGEAEVIRRMQDHGATVQPGTPAQLQALVASELAKWKRVVAEAGLKAD